MVQQALKNNGSEIGDLMKLAHNSLYLWDQWTLCYERMLHMTPWTFSENTGAAALFTLNVALRMLQRRLPTYFSGVSLWKSLALVQRPIACSATSCAEGCVFQNYTLCLFQHFAHGKTNSNPSACSAAQTLVQRYTPWTRVHWWMDLVFPPAHGPGRGQRRSTWAPKHIKITHPLATLLKSKWYECRMVQPSNSCDFDTWYLLLEPCHKERSCWRHTPPNIMQTPLKEVGMITTRFKKKQHCANQNVVSHVPWPKCVLSLLFPMEGSTGHWGSPFSLGTWAGLRLVRVIGVLIWMKNDSIQSLLFWGLLPKHLGLRLVRLILDLYLN